MTAQFGNRDIIDGDAHIVDPGASGSRDFPRRRDQPVAELARPDAGDVALRRDRALVMGVAGKGEGRIRQREDEAAMGDAAPVEHFGLDGHRQDGFAGPDLQDLHAETLAGVVLLPHRIGTGARESSGESVALTFTAVSPPVSIAAFRSGSEAKRFLPRSRRACWNKPLWLQVQSFSQASWPPWCQRSPRAGEPRRERNHSYFC